MTAGQWFLLAAGSVAAVFAGRAISQFIDFWRLSQRAMLRAEQYREAQRDREAAELEDAERLIDREMDEEEPPPPPAGFGRITLVSGKTVDYKLPLGPGAAAPEPPPATPDQQPVRCNVCRRILTGKEAIRHGQGRVCRRKAIAAATGAGAQ